MATEAEMGEIEEMHSKEEGKGFYFINLVLIVFWFSCRRSNFKRGYF